MREDPSHAPGGRRPAHNPPAPVNRGQADRPDERQPLWRRAASGAGGEAPPRPLQSYRDAAPAWPPPPERRDAPPYPLQRGGLPSAASYLGEDNQAYILRDLASGEETRVPKRRAAPDPFPPTRQNHAPGAGLLRASGYALLGTLLGGAPGVVLGIVVVVVALIRLDQFERRARAWRKKQKKTAERDQAQRLPARATSERLRLMTALWQSLGAVTLGGAALLLLLTALR